MRGQPRGEIYKGSVPTLGDSTDRFLDLDTKQSVLNLCDIWSSNIHHIMNEPSVGMYRIVEHVRTKVPMMVEQKNMLKTKKVNEKIYDADYAILACKSINTNTPWIFSDSIRILKNNFVSVPLVQQPNTQGITRKQPRPANLITTQQPPQQQQALSSHQTITPVSSPPPQQPILNPIPTTTSLKEETSAISSSKSTASETQVATASNKSNTTTGVANVSNKSGQSSHNGSVSGDNNTILTVANSTPLILDEPKQEEEQQTIAVQQQQEQQEPVITPQEVITTTEDETILDPTDSVPTLPTSIEEPSTIITTNTATDSSSEASAVVVTTLESPSSPQGQPLAEVQGGDEWSSLAIQPPTASTSSKKKKANKKKKKKASAEEDDDDLVLTPKTF